jgi:hypothetical protein
MTTNPQYVYKGGWTNWDGNSISGGRITMTAKSAVILNVFSGIFIAFIEGGFWSLLVYGMHRIRSSKHAKRPLDALDLQKQVILRNSSSDISTSVSMYSLWKIWKPQNIRAFNRTFYVLIIAALNFLFFVIALPFLFTLISGSTGDEVLLRIPNCGFWEDSLTVEEVATITLLENRTWDGVKYVGNCYSTAAPSSLCDDTLVSRKINWIPDWSAGCPFASGLCWGGDDFAFSMLTNPIDTHSDLGINAPPDERLILQRQATCAPLNLTGRTDFIPGTLEGEVYEIYYFGASLGPNYTTSASSYSLASDAGYVLS